MLVPLGTENLLGQLCGAGRASPERVRQTVDAEFPCRSTWDGTRASGGESRYFLSMISAGFDAEVVRDFHQRRRGNITRLSYVQPTLEVIRSYEYPRVAAILRRCERSTETEPIRCRWVFGFNLPLYARGWKVAPDAVATDGLFDVCTFERGSVGNVVRYLWHVIWQSHLRLADANLSRSRGCGSKRRTAPTWPTRSMAISAARCRLMSRCSRGELRLLVMPEVAGGWALHVVPTT